MNTFVTPLGVTHAVTNYKHLITIVQRDSSNMCQFEQSIYHCSFKYSLKTRVKVITDKLSHLRRPNRDQLVNFYFCKRISTLIDNNKSFIWHKNLNKVVC